MGWWSRLVKSLKRTNDRAKSEIEAFKAERRWRCARCGEGCDGHKWQHEEADTCNWCNAFDEMAEEKRRERIAVLAAHVASKNVQTDYRGNVDARMTAESAWQIAEQLYELEQSRRPKPTSSPGNGSKQSH